MPDHQIIRARWLPGQVGPDDIPGRARAFRGLHPLRGPTSPSPSPGGSVSVSTEQRYLPSSRFQRSNCNQALPSPEIHQASPNLTSPQHLPATADGCHVVKKD
ncbi:hypothetical protein VTJ04DRAFT_5506 [Mycothermus thermophilus]|uniref:uncharacterized protein n=1 Tax=Humicola insolens TaxID=85995 RepID=UPI0037446F83